MIRLLYLVHMRETMGPLIVLTVALAARVAVAAADIVTFRSGQLALHGVLYKPEGSGPFPAVLYNHGSAAGMLSQEAFDALGPVFVHHGWVFFGPYRRGEGLSASAGPYIGDEIEAAKRQGGIAAGAAVMVRLLETDHLDDQLAALAWLRNQYSSIRTGLPSQATRSEALKPFWALSGSGTAPQSIQRAVLKAGRSRRNCNRS
jgi:hypothetical protein